MQTWYLLPTGSEERKVFRDGSIPVAILPSCQDIYFFFIERILLNIHRDLPDLGADFFRKRVVDFGVWGGGNKSNM